MAQSSSTASIADKLLKLSKAKEEGVITQADFEVHRDALMTEARGGPAAPPIPSASLSEPPPPAPAAQAVPVAAPHAAIVVATNQPAQQVCLMTYFCYPVTLGQLYSRAVEPMSCKKVETDSYTHSSC
mmetsp:Transcript_87118/g.247250  ORF Transcript_87118/g.247250 Transcript_87118/m.247250 type:complete len:128 (+) Transcript_87118:136-519(+)